MTDKELRPLIRAQLAQDHPGAVLVEELSLLREKRADLAVVNDALWGYEIKSERDKLDRLPEQVPFYNAVFDFCYIIAADKYVTRISRLVPRSWGIWRITSGNEIVFERDPKRNTRTTVLAQARLLWKPEAVQILVNAGIDASPDTALIRVWKLLEKVPREQLDRAVREAVKLRKIREGHLQLGQSGD